MLKTWYPALTQLSSFWCSERHRITPLSLHYHRQTLSATHRPVLNQVQHFFSAIPNAPANDMCGTDYNWPAQPGNLFMQERLISRAQGSTVQVRNTFSAISCPVHTGVMFIICEGANPTSPITSTFVFFSRDIVGTTCSSVAIFAYSHSWWHKALV